ncbi:unnamed protein product [Adineta ricciae]|uniref:Nuclear receptor domain-containing protein n=1 Tax=Adineta ricciae TaxID=249248 RepID=A0A813VP81_ADIRI|nr:unnamed protein product [Adineta ricciae]CAF0840397.1 unnamed protein product [Adineta ricciae]
MDNEESSLTCSTPQAKPTGSICKICESPASHSYFGAIACSACKMFFRRNAEKDLEQFKCAYDGKCEVNLKNRHVCSACRLAKCFASGMEVERIRCSMPMKKIIKTQHRTTTDPPSSVTNLLSDYSTLSSSQWNHISKLIFYHDTYGPLSVVQHFFSEQVALPAKLRYKALALNDFFTSVYLKAEQVLINNEDYRRLSSQDQSTLIHQTLRHAGAFAGIFVSHQTKLLDDTLFYKANESLFGSSTMTSLKFITNSLDDDVVFIKLIVAILFFSPANYTSFTDRIAQSFIDPQMILSIQNTYIELAWKYMTYKHSFQYAVLCFAELLRSLFHYYRIAVQADIVDTFTTMIHSVINQTKEIVLVSDN